MLATVYCSVLIALILRPMPTTIENQVVWLKRYPSVTIVVEVCGRAYA